MINRILPILLTSLIWFGCKPKNHQQEELSENLLKHATNLTIVKSNNGFEVTIHEVYKGSSTPFTYLLTDQPISRSTKSDHRLLQLPIENIAASSTGQIAFLDQLDALNLLSGFTNFKFISSPRALELINTGVVTALGQDAKNVEAVIDLSPAVMLGYSVTPDISHWERINELGVPVLFDASHLEETPLAQAEWIKLYGALTGNFDAADSIFNAIEKRYLDLIDKVVNTRSQPSVIAGSMYNGTWFMPGKDSWVAQYIEDAGGDYLFNQLEGNGSTPLSFEVVYQQGLNADLWIGATSFNSLDHLISEDDRYMKFDFVKGGQIFTPTKRTNLKGANDYYEQGITRPDIVLSDFIEMISSDSLDADRLYFYERLN